MMGEYPYDAIISLVCSHLLVPPRNAMPFLRETLAQNGTSLLGDTSPEYVCDMSLWSKDTSAMPQLTQVPRADELIN